MSSWMIIYEEQLKVSKFDGSEERAELCRKSREYVANLEKQKKRIKRVNMIVDAICNLVFGTAVIGGFMFFLFLASIEI